MFHIWFCEHEFTVCEFVDNVPLKEERLTIRCSDVKIGKHITSIAII